MNTPVILPPLNHLTDQQIKDLVEQLQAELESRKLKVNVAPAEASAKYRGWVEKTLFEWEVDKTKNL